MIEEMLDSSIGRTGGGLSVCLSIVMNVYNWISVDDINGVVVLITSSFALLFLFFKIKGQILDNKIKKHKLEDLEEEDSED